MFITIRQLLSLMEPHDFISIYDCGKEEFTGMVSDCELVVPNATLDTYVASIRTLAFYGESKLCIYKEVTNEQ